MFHLQVLCTSLCQYYSVSICSMKVSRALRLRAVARKVTGVLPTHQHERASSCYSNQTHTTLPMHETQVCHVVIIGGEGRADLYNAIDYYYSDYNIYYPLR